MGTPRQSEWMTARQGCGNVAFMNHGLIARLAVREASILSALAFLAMPALTGCTAASPPMVAAHAAEKGTILAARPVNDGGAAEAASARSGVLGMIGMRAPAKPVAATEFLVRVGAHKVISVIQPDPTFLASGERVRVLRGETTRLVAVRD